MPLQNAIDVPTNALSPQLSNITFKSNPVISKSTGIAGSVSQGDTNIWSVGNGLVLESFNNIAITAVNPVISATGLNIDNVVGKVSGGIELSEGALAGSKSAFVAGTSAAFFVQATFNIATLANATECFVGFRKAAAYNATLTNYTDYATIGVHGTAGHIQLQTQIASGGNVVTDTTNLAVAATNFTVRVNVSAAGVVTYLLNGVAPTTVAAYTLAANTVVPFIWYLTPAGGHSEVDLVSYSCGLQ